MCQENIFARSLPFQKRAPRCFIILLDNSQLKEIGRLREKLMKNWPQQRRTRLLDGAHHSFLLADPEHSRQLTAFGVVLVVSGHHIKN